MYNQSNIPVKPAKSLKLLLLCLHGLLLLAYWQARSQWLYCLPLIAIQGYYLHLLLNNKFNFLKQRHWRVLNGQFFLLDSQHAQQEMDAKAVSIWPFVLIFMYRVNETENPNAKWQLEIITKDATSTESFHQMAAQLNTLKSETSHG